MQIRPKIAIIDPNTLSALGLKGILQNVMPIMTVDIYSSFAEFSANIPDEFFHYFVNVNIVLDNRDYFNERRRKAIVLTTSPENQPSGFHSLLSLQQHAHPHGKNLPPLPKVLEQKILSDREIEVMNLIVQGFINKEIADKLNIGLATVVTHRRNIMDKLGVKSVSALTIYAVMHGYVDINSI